jgi:hypothetical protein
MSSSRVRAALSIGSVCIFLLFLLLPQMSPGPVKAAWDSKIPNCAPKDPGTPFEEPEGGNPGNTPDPSVRPASIHGGQQPTPTAGLAPGAAKIVLRQLLLQRLVLILWHLQ